MIEQKADTLTLLCDGEEPRVLSVAFPVGSVAADVYTLRTTLRADETLLAKKHIFLTLEGLYARVSVALNGIPVGDGSVSGACAHLNVKGMLHAADNILTLTVCKQEGIPAYTPLLTQVRLRASDGALLDCVCARQTLREGKVTVRADIRAVAGTGVPEGMLTLVSPADKVYYAGFSGTQASLVIPDPTLWFPGEGGSQGIYRMCVSTYLNTEVEEVMETKLPIFSSSVVNLPGNGFSMRVNGEDIFVKAARVDALCSTETYSEEALASVVRAAARLHLNALYVPGEGPMPPAAFYEACASEGLMVLQGIVPPVPGEEDYIRRVRALVRRAASYAVVALLILPAQTEKESADAVRAVCNMDCPWLPVRAVTEQVCTEQVRFVPGFSALPTVRALYTDTGVAPDARLNLYSEEIEARMSHPQDVSRILGAAAQRYLYPATMQAVSYLSGMLQGEYVRTQVGASVRGGVIFPALADADARISPAFVDAFGREKPGAAPVRRALAPLRLYAEETDATVRISVINETRQPYHTTLTVRLCDRQNASRMSESCSVEAAPHTSRVVYEKNLAGALAGARRSVYLHALLGTDAMPLAQYTLLFCPPKYFRFGAPAPLHVQVEGDGRQFFLTIRSQGFAPGTFLWLEGEDALFSDNELDLCRDMPVRLTVISAQRMSAQTFARCLRALTFPDVGDAGMTPLVLS